MKNADGGSGAHVDEQVAARYLGVSVAWLRKQRNKQQGPPFRKFGALVRYQLDELAKWASTRGQFHNAGGDHESS
jgi:hypothetical protein